LWCFIYETQAKFHLTKIVIRVIFWLIIGLFTFKIRWNGRIVPDIFALAILARLKVNKLFLTFLQDFSNILVVRRILVVKRTLVLRRRELALIRLAIVHDVQVVRICTFVIEGLIMLRILERLMLTRLSLLHLHHKIFACCLIGRLSRYLSWVKWLSRCVLLHHLLLIELHELAFELYFLSKKFISDCQICCLITLPLFVWIIKYGVVRILIFMNWWIVVAFKCIRVLRLVKIVWSRTSPLLKVILLQSGDLFSYTARTHIHHITVAQGVEAVLIQFKHRLTRKPIVLVFT